MDIEKALVQQFGNNISFETIDAHTNRLYLPAFHEDGDMLSIYITKDDLTGEYLVHDFGNTLMRLSYTFDMESEHKRKVLSDVVASFSGQLSDDDLLLKTYNQNLAQTVLQYVQLIAKVSNIDILRREVIRSLFYEELANYIEENFSNFSPRPQYVPIQNRTDLVADWAFNTKNKPLFLYGVKDNSKAKDVTICCLEFWKASLPFSSIIIYDDFYSLSKNQQVRLTNVADKQFMSLNDFKSDGLNYFQRVLA